MKKRLINLRGVAFNRLDNEDQTPREIWLTEGADALTEKPSNSPYDFELYKSIQVAIEEGIITIGNVNSSCCPKGIFDDDQDAINNGLEEGDVYELSTSNTISPLVNSLLKVVREQVLIASGDVLGTGEANVVLGTGQTDQNGNPIVLGIN